MTVYRSSCGCLRSDPEPSYGDPISGRDGRLLTGAAFIAAYRKRVAAWAADWDQEIREHIARGCPLTQPEPGDGAGVLPA